MHKRGLKVALVAVLTLIFVLGAVGVAFAQWNDLSLSILGDYGVTEQQVANISDGFVDGSWQPYKAMPRKQFVKMAVDAYKIPLVSPAIPTYSDVPASDDYYEYVEAATAAGLTNGVGGGKMEPNTIITREQAVAIIARWVADKNGYNLDTMYTDADAAAILGAFPDASAVGPSLQKEMAFAVDFGIVWGDASGKLAAKANLSRIQGAAMLIRSLDIIPLTEPVVPVKIELVPATPDEAENLIGLTHQYTYKVTQADGSAAPGVLVDFDTLLAPWYVGNIQPAAALSDANGEVTVNLVSTEVGIERVSASAPGVAAIWSTKYWLALDEVYILDDTRSAQNNAGTTHTWEARVLVFGPGPLSTSQSDWYNLYDPAGDPSHPLEADGVDAEEDYNVDYSSYADELDWTDDGYLGRSMAGIPVFWQIQNLVDDVPSTPADETVASVGTIVAAAEDGEIAADGMSAWAATDADGLTSIDIMSEETGETWVTAEANYEGNPYEWQLFHHLTNNDFEDHFLDFQDQPGDYAWAFKTWIPHVIGGGDTPISPAFTEGNTGEQFTLTIHLEDVFGNAVTGRQVEWSMQGVGFFITDDQGDTQDMNNPAGNRDFDTTDLAGEATVVVKSLKPGEQIVHAKVRDKGIDGNEGPFSTYDAEVQWFDVDVVTFDDPATPAKNEAVSANPVGGTHTFTVNVLGLKLELDASIDAPAGQTPYIDTDAAGSSYDGKFDSKDAVYLGGILLVNESQQPDGEAGPGLFAQDLNGNGIIDPSEAGTYVAHVQGRDIMITAVGGYTRYDWNHDGFMEDFTGQTGIYLPLEGKTVNFDLGNGPDNFYPYDPADPYKGDSNLGANFNGLVVDAVGNVTPASAVTDADGQATVTVASDTKGPETVRATVTYPGNWHLGSQLRRAFAKKLWQAGDADDVNVTVTLDGVDVTDGGQVSNPVFGPDGLLNSGHIEVHVTDAFGNDLPDYEVVYTLEGLGTPPSTPTQGADATYIPLARLTDNDTQNVIGGIPYDQNVDLPDSNEPTPESDPFAVIVGDGDTSAFYFNNWLNPSKPAVFDGLPANPVNDALSFVQWPTGRVAFAPWELNGGVYSGPPTLVADGAKAWTLDGFTFATQEMVDAGLLVNGVAAALGDIVPNALTGSNIDVQLLEDPSAVFEGLDYETIIQIQVIKPFDGVKLGAGPNDIVYSKQIHKLWEAPVLTSMVLEQLIFGSDPESWVQTNENVTVGNPIDLRVQMLDLTGQPIFNTDFPFAKIKIGGSVFSFPVTMTDADGYLFYSFTPGTTGTVTFQAWNDLDGDNVPDTSELKSNSKTDTVQVGAPIG